MKQLIVDYLPFEVRPEQINESMKENSGKLIVKGVLQRAEAIADSTDAKANPHPGLPELD